MDPSDIQFQQTTGLGKFLQYTKLITIANITIHNWKLYKKKKKNKNTGTSSNNRRNFNVDSPRHCNKIP